TFTEWADLIQANFEKCYYIPLKPEDDSKYDVNPEMVRRRGIYKDLYKSGKEYEDYQFRFDLSVLRLIVVVDRIPQAKLCHYPRSRTFLVYEGACLSPSRPC